MDSTGAWPAGSGAGFEAATGPGIAGALAGIEASTAAIGRIIRPHLEDSIALDNSTALDDSTAGRGAAGDADSDPLLGSDPLRRRLDACLNALAEVSRADAKNAALKVHLAAEIVELEEALAAPAVTAQDATAQEMSVTAEIACALTVSERAAGALISESQALTSILPQTLSALQSGSISWQHARIMVDETSNLDPDGAAALEAHFLDPGAPTPARGPAGELVPSRFRARARSWRERHHPLSIEKRHAKGVQDRRLEYQPDRDGMAWLSAYLPADQASGIWDRTTTAARALQGPHENRTLTQLRADLAATWLLTNNTHGTLAAATAMADDGTLGGRGDRTYSGTKSGQTRRGIGDHMMGGTGTASSIGGTGTGTSSGTGSGTSFDGGSGTGTSSDTSLDGGTDSRSGVPSPAAQVLITVPVMALLGATDEPATLDGYGPIPPSMARRLISDGATSFMRVLTDPRDGAPLEIGRTSYRITKAMRQWLRLRDGKCPFPGCNNHSLDNEADHLLAWARGGTTGISNLGQPCPKHHRLKHTTAWTPTGASKNKPPGWTSPTGRHYPSEQPDWEPPRWPTQPGRSRAHQDAGSDMHPDVDSEVLSDTSGDMDLDPTLPVDPFPEWSLWPAAEPDNHLCWPPEYPLPDELTPANLEFAGDPLRDGHLVQQA
ncbi:HNH endonuclease signature motif containing protein [Arthrobacter sp. CDRTa11]|uniref:HNH endonuclease signature motif containing protein n=1 Tax=Arthrobacter sp. CDRTa11 TaxID=2651199 RepID=UPI002265C5A6|nr:HNH endonuclease signature motif containing protein [Arthrobacter sp. CDRTa11]